MQWRSVYIMQLTTELHVLTLQGHHQAYKIMELTKAHAVILPTGSRGLQFQCTLPHVPWLIPLFYKPDGGPVGPKHVAQLLVA